MSHSETIPVPICSACAAGRHYSCSRQSPVDAIRRVEDCECRCDTCDQIREDALQDRLAEREEGKEESSD